MYNHKNVSKDKKMFKSATGLDPDDILASFSV